MLNDSSGTAMVEAILPASNDDNGDDFDIDEDEKSNVSYDNK